MESSVLMFLAQLPFDTGGSAIAMETFTGEHTLHILVRLACAFVLGAAIAYRPWRRLPGGRAPRVPRETAQAQTIIAVAGALMVIVIGDSLARAFGLVGLGTFIRFRAGIKDPRDVAIMFMMIGVGMACGLGLVPTAAVGTLFVGAVLALFDRFGKAHRRLLRVSVTGADPAAVNESLCAAFPGARAICLPANGPGRGKSVFEIEAGEADDAISIRRAIEGGGVVSIGTIRVNRD
jgi:hypothetical protein